ncbi:MAG: hypothetical protein AAGI22_08245 [Planctomycetota bacterium]
MTTDHRSLPALRRGTRRLLALVAAASAGCAGTDEAPAPPSFETIAEARVGSVRATESTPLVAELVAEPRAEDRVALSIAVEIHEGWHAYASVEEGEAYVPLTPTLDLPAGAERVSEWRHVRPASAAVSADPAWLQGSFAYTCEVEGLDDLSELVCELRYQVCNAQACLPPTTTELVVESREPAPIEAAAAVARTAPEFQPLVDEYNAAFRAWRNADRADGTDDPDPLGAFLPRFQAGASAHAGSPEAFDYLRWILSSGWRVDQDAALAALDDLLDDHLRDPRISRVAFVLALRTTRHGFPRERALEAIGAIDGAAATDEDRAEARYWRAYLLSKTDEDGTDLDRVLADLAFAAERGTPETREEAFGLRTRLTQLQLGQPAPEIEGVDLDGASFKLSDYRGKVVLLDFWGDW